MAEHGLDSAVKLASNESPFGPLPGVRRGGRAAAIDGSAATRTTSRRPLRETLAERHGVDPDRVAVGCGSVGLLQQLLLAFAGPGDEVLFPWPSFIAYPQFTLLAGATVTEAPLTPGRPTSTRCSARGHTAHDDGADRQPEQPDQHRAPHGRARAPGRRRCRRTSWS